MVLQAISFMLLGILWDLGFDFSTKEDFCGVLGF